MTNAKAILAISAVSMAFLASAASGGAPMGPPMALLGEGQWGVGGEYGHDSISLKADGDLRPVYTGVGYSFDETVKLDDLAMNMLFVTAGYGVCDNWDVFLRLGAVDAQGDIKGRGNIPYDPSVPADFLDVSPRTYDLGDLDSSFGFAWGLGTRATFARSGPWTFGGLVQLTWFKPGDSSVCCDDPLFPGMGVTHDGDASLDFWETQVSLAVSYQVDTWRLWAGPYLQFVVGDFDRSGAILVSGVNTGTFKASGDLQQESEIGGHFGADVGVSEQLDVWLEGQVTGDSWFFGVGLIFKPQEAFGM